MTMVLEEGQEPLRALAPGAHIHMIGVAGAGMNALAAVLLARGYVVSGSDLQTGAQVEKLAGQGLTFYQGHAPEQVAGADAVIYSAAVRDENPELAAAHQAGIPVVKRAAALGWLLEGLRTIAVAGTHGKTTTTSMLAVILRHAGIDPTFVVGGEVLDLGASASWGTGEWAVVEADEYDRSFLQLRPEVAVITTVEADHLEYFGSAAAMYAAYDDFIARIVPDGSLVINLDDPYLGEELVVPEQLRLARCAYRSQEWHEWHFSRITTLPDGSSFRLNNSDLSQGREDLVTLTLSGIHNAQNAVLAIAAAVLAGVRMETAIEALRAFRGAGRRFQVVGETAGVLVVDDYAHHPTEIRATLTAARARYPNRRLVAVFQPHTYSRTQLLFDAFVTAFDGADMVVLTAIYAARETDTLGISAGTLADAITARPGMPPVQLIDDMAKLPATLAPQLGAGDVVLTMGAGTITEVGPRLLAQLSGTKRRARATTPTAPKRPRKPALPKESAPPKEPVTTKGRGTRGRRRSDA
jgi:UDP-N-acetylmuramate--alanine ligase